MSSTFLGGDTFSLISGGSGGGINPVTGTGTVNTVAKFTGTSTIGNSNITDSGSLITLGSTTTISSGALGIGTASPGAPLDIHGTGTLVQLNGTGSNNSYLVFQNAGVSKWRIGNTYNGAANTFDLYNNTLASNALSFNVSTNKATFSADATINGLTVGRGNGNINTNTTVGASAGNANTTGFNNTFIGSSSGLRNSTGYDNTFVGESAGQNSTTGNSNTFLGREAGLINITGSNNTAIGWNALRFKTIGDNNVGLGYGAGYDIGTFTGYNASNSIFIGSFSKAAGDNQTNQIVIGTEISGLGSNTTLIGNTFTTATAIYGNLLLGTTTNAGYKLDVNGTARFIEISVGTTFPITLEGAGGGPKINFSNLFQIGAYDSRNNIATKDRNLAILSTISSTEDARLQLFANTANILIQNGGTFTDAGYRLDVNGTTRLQADALINGLTVGKGSGNINTNTVVGFTAGLNNTNGNQNTFVGFEAGIYNSTGSENTFVGVSAGKNNLTGYGNTVVGRESFLQNTTGDYNTAIGWNAFRAKQTGGDNIAIGYNAGRGLGNDNLYTVNSSIFIGVYARAAADNQSNQIVIGYGTTGLGSNTTVIGNSSTLTTAIYGNLLLGKTTGTGQKLEVNGGIYLSSTILIENTNIQYGLHTGNDGIQFTAGPGGVYLDYGMTSWGSLSDERFKNIDSEILNATESLMTLRTIKYSLKDDERNKINLGLIAQDVVKVFPEIVDIQNNEIGTMGVRYTELIPVLVKAIQELKVEIEKLKTQIKI